MQAATPLTRDVVLVGGGHAHALVLRRWGMAPLPGVRLTLVNPGPDAPYTGMLPGHVAGHYPRDALDIDLVRLARHAGARWIDGAVTAIDAGARRLTVPGRAPVAYDVASLDVGITSDMPDLPGFAEHAVPAKPLDAYAARWRAFREAARAGRADPRVAVIGGGVAGVELALAMAHALRAVPGAAVTVIESGPSIWGPTPRAAAALARAADALGVTVRTGAAIVRISDGAVELADGETVPAGFVAGAAGARPHDWLAASGLPCADGFVRVGPTLGVEGHPTLFAAGDCAHLTHAPRPKAGVFAVRAAPILHDNLRAAITGGRMRAFRPQRRFLKLVSLGGKDALADRGGLSLAHPWLWRWKDQIDRRFMERLTDLPPMRIAPPPPPAGAEADPVFLKPMCAGCGSKVAPGALALALADLPPGTRADVLSRPGDDAAVLDAGGGRRQVATVDHLRAVTEDWGLMARIATVHALGDVWAMGAAPQAALATLVLPRMTEPLQRRTLGEMLHAIADVLGGAGAELVGGHSMMGAELSVGLSLTGLTEDAAIGHDGARPGDALILTRPIGTGTVLAAEMAGRARGRDVAATLAAMARPQGNAAAILAGAHAMTDVTGFGLAGHLAAIARASGAGARLDLAAIPLHPGAEALAAAGIRSTAHAANRAHAPVEAPDTPRAALLHDPQTAGGLLAAVAPARADALVASLRAAGHDAARIGEVTAAPGLEAR